MIETPDTRFAATLIPSPGIHAIPHIAAFLRETRRILPLGARRSWADSVVGWGLKPSAERARAIAVERGVPFLSIEDGFVRSIGLGEAGAPPVSLVVDDLGIYYDAHRPSRLEAILADPAPMDDALLDRAERLIARIVASGISKTNLSPPMVSKLPNAGGRRRVLVIDQTYGDASIAGGLVDEGAFATMLAAARADEHDAEIIVRRHPAVAAGLKRGCIPEEMLAGTTRLEHDLRVAELFGQVDAVYVVTSLAGFEALLHGLPVRCFGAPFYAGWGATRDEFAIARRGRPRSVAEIFAAAYLRYARYVDPLTGHATDAETAIERLLLFRAHSDANAGLSAAVGFSRWKRGATRRLLASPRGRIEFSDTVAEAERTARAAGGRIVVWSGRETAALRAEFARVEVPVVRVEDGFIRSAGLGSAFNASASIVLDDLGIHYDPARLSRLELILERGETCSATLLRARAMRDRLVASGVTKYNVGRGAAPAWPRDRPAVLVVGQVENDRSIELGCADIRTNAALIETVRRDHPDSLLIYKPHPDVEAGHRSGGVPASVISANVDVVVRRTAIAACLPHVDRLATLTSLAGFEALLRGLPVTTYGGPFYAGWGLTTDRLAFPRRTRRLSLDELVAGALITYPLYIDPKTGLPCPPEHLIEVLAAGRPGSRLAMRWRYLRGLIDGVRREPACF